jgi:hypothetical protein
VRVQNVCRLVSARDPIQVEPENGNLSTTNRDGVGCRLGRETVTPSQQLNSASSRSRSLKTAEALPKNDPNLATMSFRNSLNQSYICRSPFFTERTQLASQCLARARPATGAKRDSKDMHRHCAGRIRACQPTQDPIAPCAKCFREILPQRIRSPCRPRGSDPSATKNGVGVLSEVRKMRILYYGVKNKLIVTAAWFAIRPAPSRIRSAVGGFVVTSRRAGAACSALDAK